MDPNSYNPYAAPHARTDFAAGATGVLGSPEGWEIGEVLGRAWSAFAANWGLLLGTLLLSTVAIYVIALVLGIGSALVFHGGSHPAIGSPFAVTPGFFGVQFVITVVTYLVEAFVAVGYWRIAIAAARGERATLTLFLGGGGRYLTMLLLMLAIVYTRLSGRTAPSPVDPSMASGPF